MFEPYHDRLIVIRDLLVSPQPDTVQEAYELLFQLWMKYSGNGSFIAEIREISKEHPEIIQDFIDRLNRLDLDEAEKDFFLERVILIYSSQKMNFQPMKERGGMVDIDKPNEREKLKIINLFLASSSELKDDRNQVEIWVNRENNKLIENGFFLRLNLWEDFLDAMSKTRLQDEYNKIVVKSDVVICLFATKVGKYTEEEFEVAYANFKEKGKPKYIYTYFKEMQISTSNMNLDDLIGLQSFKEKLSALGHFYTIYKSTEDLIRQLKNQLDKIFDEML